MKNVNSRTAYAIKILRVQSIAFLTDQAIVNFSPELVWLASFFGRPTNGKDGRAESRTIARFRECLDFAQPLADRCLYPESLCLSKGLGASEVCAMASKLGMTLLMLLVAKTRMVVLVGPERCVHRRSSNGYPTGTT